MAFNPSILFKHWTYRIFSPDTILQETYRAFKRLLKHDAHAHELMAELEMMYHDNSREDLTALQKRYRQLGKAVHGMVDCLKEMNPGAYGDLQDYFRKFDFYINFLLSPPLADSSPPFLYHLSSPVDSPGQVGNKAFHLAELRRINASTPEAFVLSASSFHLFIEHNSLRNKIDDILAKTDIYSSSSLKKYSGRLQELILSAKIPANITADMEEACDHIESQGKYPVRFAVRSSAVGEDESGRSFAGQYKTILAVSRADLANAYLQVLASKYSPQALFYRISLGLSDEETAMAVIVMEMITARAGGVIYSREPTEERNDTILVQSVHGGGEALVSGTLSPDTFIISRKNYTVIRKQQKYRTNKLVTGVNRLINVPLPEQEQQTMSITDEQARQLARSGADLEHLYGCPQDVEWVINDENIIFILQSRSLAIRNKTTSGHENQDYRQIDREPLLSGGEKAAGGTAHGLLYIAGEDYPLDDIPEGSILFTKNTPPSLIQVMNRLVGVISKQGGTASHFATVCREAGIPLLTGIDLSLPPLAHGELITLDADNKNIYSGKIETLLKGKKTGNSSEKTPWFKRLRAVLDFITPLKLIDPYSSQFVPGSCRSLHDIIRFSHEKAMQIMFSLGSGSGLYGKKRKLESKLPIEVFLVDVGGGICKDFKNENNIPPDHICSVPFTAVWKGLSNKDIDWPPRNHFDWKTYDTVMMAGGIVAKDASELASYAVIGLDYLHFAMKFGYHFTQVDALCGATRQDNYCLMRFSGGGGNYHGRSLRIQFLINILEKTGFKVDVRADLLDARMIGVDSETLAGKLEILGRLLATTRLMDMVLKSNAMVEWCVEEFFQGRYNFYKRSEMDSNI